MRLIAVLPDYYDDNETMQEIQGNLSQESDNLEDGLANTLKEIYWTSATGKGLLSRHERIFGIIPDAGKSDRYRREKISAKAAGAATTLVALIRNIAESYTNAAVEIKEDNPRYRATVRFTGTLKTSKRVSKKRFHAISGYCMSIFSTLMELLEPSRMNSLLHLLIIRFEMDT